MFLSVILGLHLISMLVWLKSMPVSNVLCSLLGAGSLMVAGLAIPLEQSVSSTVLPIPLLMPVQAATPLAKSLYGKPVVVVVYAKWCENCQTIAPTLTALRQQYGAKIHYITFDVTTRATALKSAKLANTYGLGNFFDTYKARTSTVAVFDPLTGHIVKIYQNNRNLMDYRRVIDYELRHQDGEAI